MSRPYNPGPWYRQRNAQIYELARALTPIDDIARRFGLKRDTVEEIILNEQRRRSEPKALPMRGKIME